MIVLSGDSADDLWLQAKTHVVEEPAASVEESRGGSCRERLGVTLCLTNPRDRWVASRRPVINLPFALAEVIWIVTGQKESSFLNFFNSRLPLFAGSDNHYYGAYGFRLRHHFDVDQVSSAFETLKLNPTSRQVVLQIWDSRSDLPQELGKPRSADIPCNIVSLLKIRENRLHWTQVMRSNDLHRGLPYNFVQFTFLHELMCAWLEVEPGPYTHIVDSLHCYISDLEQVAGARKLQCPANTDRIAGSKAELEALLSEVYVLIKDAMVGEWMGETRYSDLLSSMQEKLPEFLFNILSVLLAEVRRRKFPGQFGDSTLFAQSNPAYTYLWDLWISRTQRNARTTE